jgi:hypothetical protein
VVTGLYEYPIPNNSDEFHTKHVKCPVAGENTGLLKLYNLISSYHKSILFFINLITSFPWPWK